MTRAILGLAAFVVAVAAFRWLSRVPDVRWVPFEEPYDQEAMFV